MERPPDEPVIPPEPSEEEGSGDYVEEGEDEDDEEMANYRRSNN